MFTKTAIESYFSAIKTQNLMLMVIGGVAVLAAIFFFVYNKTQWHRGLAVPLIVFGMMHCVAGYTNYKKADPLRVRNTYTYDMKPSALRIQELPRLQDLQRSTTKFIYINLGLLIAAGGIFFFFRHKEMSAHYTGVVAGLALMCVITLLSSFYLRSKTQKYVAGIESFTKEYKMQ